MNVASDNIVGIHGAPRSGTSWLGELLNSSESVTYRYQPFFSYAFRGRLQVSASRDQMLSTFRDLLHTQDEFVLQKGKERLADRLPEFDKSAPSHLVYKEVRFHQLLPDLLRKLPNFRVICIVRDPRAVLASWVSAPREFDQEWDILKEWRYAKRKNVGRSENWYGFERWKELTQLFMNLRDSYPKKSRIVRYENLVSNPIEELQQVFDFCGLRMANQTYQFVKESTSRNDDNPYGVYRSNEEAVTERWRQRLPSEISATISYELEGGELSQFLSTAQE